MIETRVTDAEARGALRRFFDRLTDAEKAEQLAAQRLASEAASTAAGYPTPQARLAASGLQVSGSAVIVGRPSGVDAGAGFVRGAIFGGRWPSLAPPRAGGYWLIPDAYTGQLQYLEPIADHVRDAVRRLDRDA